MGWVHLGEWKGLQTVGGHRWSGAAGPSFSSAVLHEVSELKNKMLLVTGFPWQSRWSLGCRAKSDCTLQHRQEGYKEAEGKVKVLGRGFYPELSAGSQEDGQFLINPY